MNKSGYAHEFACPHNGCNLPEHRIKIGKTMATPLSGFLAGVVFTAIILLPALYLMGELYPIGILQRL